MGPSGLITKTKNMLGVESGGGTSVQVKKKKKEKQNCDAWCAENAKGNKLQVTSNKGRWEMTSKTLHVPKGSNN